jgi:predicted dehydrogenase
LSAPAPLRMGLAGCGRIAERGYLPAFRALPQMELVAVADPDPARAATLATALGGVESFPDAATLLAAGGLDALIVATPSGDHLEVASQAAAAGLPCLVEKPPASHLQDAVRLAALEPAPAFGFNRRFLQGRELGPSIPAEGWLDLDLLLRFRRDRWAAHAGHDEALLDAGIHLIDLASFLTGSPPIAVRGADLAPERADLELELGRGRARLRCSTDGRYAERVEVRDRAGRLRAAGTLGGLAAKLGRLRGRPEPLALSLRRQLECFATAIGGGGQGDLAGAADGVSALAVVEAARRSARLGGAEVTVAQAVSAPHAAAPRGPA